MTVAVLYILDILVSNALHWTVQDFKNGVKIPSGMGTSKPSILGKGNVSKPVFDETAGCGVSICKKTGPSIVVL
jgi:hypothetical protein